MTPISIVELAAVTGGARGQRPDQIADRKKFLCNTPNPTEARRHYDAMVQHMGPGVWPRTIKAMGELCGWPVPPEAQNAKPLR